MNLNKGNQKLVSVFDPQNVVLKDLGLSLTKKKMKFVVRNA